jgi:hypothetical protein
MKRKTFGSSTHRRRRHARIIRAPAGARWRPKWGNWGERFEFGALKEHGAMSSGTASHVLAAVLMTASTAASVQAQSHLEPEDSVFTSVSNEYHMAVRRVLVADLPPGAVTVVTIPSFELEWVAWVVERPQPQVCSREAPTRIWNGESKPRVPRKNPTSRCSPVSSAIAADIAETWAVMLRGVRYPSPPEIRLGPDGKPYQLITLTSDGTSYHFSAFDADNYLAGQIHSPPEDSVTGRLVVAVEALRKHSVSPSSESERLLCRLVAAIQPEGRGAPRCSAP